MVCQHPSWRPERVITPPIYTSALFSLGAKMQKKKMTESQSAELKLRALVDKRNEFNDQANAFREQRNMLNVEKGKKFDEIIELRKVRTDNVRLMRHHRQLRNEYQARAKALLEAKKKRRKDIHHDLPSELEAKKANVRMMDLRQQTQAMSLSDENELIDEIKGEMREIARLERLKAEQDKVKGEVAKYSGDINELFAMADEEHKKVVEYANKANEAHEKITALMDEVAHMTVEANKNHESYIQMRAKADEWHLKAQELRQKLMAAKKEKYDEQRAARQDIVNQNKAARQALLDKDKLDKAAEDALQTLMKKGKVEIG
jgi:uncharacterized coiled-coil DUF342 family protein